LVAVGERSRIGVPALVLLVLCGGTGVVDLLHPSTLEPVGEEARVEARLAEAARWSDGSRARLIEHRLRMRSRVRTWVLPPWAALRFLVRDGGPRVALGPDGWIFIAGLRGYRDEPEVVTARRLGYRIEALARRLEQLGIVLLVVPVPEKALVYPEHLPPGLVVSRARYDALVRDLQRRSVGVLDLLALFHRAKEREEADLYWRTDTHWSCVGAALAAEEVARGAGAWVSPRDRRTTLARSGVILDAGEGFDHLGLPSKRLRQGGVERWLIEARGLLHEGPLIRVEGRVPVARPGERAAPLEDPGPGADVVFLGSSFARASGFADALHHVTNGAVHLISVRGGGALGAWEALFARGVTSLPRVVVWEFPFHPLFIQADPLAGLGDVLAALPGIGCRTVEPPFNGTPGREVQLGSLDVGRDPRSFWIHHASITSPDHPVLSLRLTGMPGAAVRMTLQAEGAESWTAAWLPGRPELTLPLPWPAAAASTFVTLQASSATTLVLDDVSLVWDLDSEAARPLVTRGPAQDPSGAEVLAIPAPADGSNSRTSLVLDFPPGTALPRVDLADTPATRPLLRDAKTRLILPLDPASGTRGVVTVSPPPAAAAVLPLRLR
jgi:hypothetical protein